MAVQIPYAINIEKETINNNVYRRVVWTGNTMQVVLQSLLPNETVEMEIHCVNDQFIRIEAGQAEILVGEKAESKSILIQYHLKDGDAIMIPALHYHKITNEGKVPLKLYTIYSPPDHPYNQIDIINPRTLFNK